MNHENPFATLPRRRSTQEEKQRHRVKPDGTCEESQTITKDHSVLEPKLGGASIAKNQSMLEEGGFKNTKTNGIERQRDGVKPKENEELCLRMPNKEEEGNQPRENTATSIDESQERCTKEWSTSLEDAGWPAATQESCGVAVSDSKEEGENTIRWEIWEIVVLLASVQPTPPRGQSHDSNEICVAQRV
ncbi:hypothetical protein NDU88_006549 [Pleurodeles waltl]|uniref:Uncharacterized protein n=1 Tax=Pleurodeles waltl TaxID=8319 RepID=A0AAV7NTE9_PLEWA|nr:hypothetical protein NDU88_006549 [Pleurodeles waltl]